MKLKKIVKTSVCALSVLLSMAAFGTEAFSVVDFSAGESGLVNNDKTPYRVNIVAEGKTAAVVPVGVGLRGDADGSGEVSLMDVIKMAKYLVGSGEEGYKGSFGYAMADVNLSGGIDLQDAINTAKYLLAKGTHDEKWASVLGK